jgi:hypothetical protein
MRDFATDLLGLITLARNGPSAYFLYQPAVMDILKRGINCTDPLMQEKLNAYLEACINAISNLDSVLWEISQQTIVAPSPFMTSEAAVETETTPKMTADVSVGTCENTFKPIRSGTPTNRKKTGFQVLVSGNDGKIESRTLVKNEESVAEPQTPITETQEPVAEAQTPIVETQEPIAEAQTPITETQEPVAEAQTPIVETQEPIAEAQTPVAERHETLANTPPATPKQTPITVEQLFGSSKQQNNTWASIAGKPPAPKPKPVQKSASDTDQIKLSEIFRSYYAESMNTDNNPLIASIKGLEASIRYNGQNKISEDTLISDMTDTIINSAGKITIDSVVICNPPVRNYVTNGDCVFRKQIKNNPEDYHQEMSYEILHEIADFIKNNPDETYDTMTPTYNGKETIQPGGIRSIRSLVRTLATAKIEKQTIKDMLIDDVIEPFAKYFVV